MWLGNRLIVVSFQWMFFSETGLQLRLFPLVSFLILPIDKACPHKGKGMYTGRPRQMLLCATSRGEINVLKALVHEIDPKAFVIISQAHEVLGEGFRKLVKDD